MYKFLDPHNFRKICYILIFSLLVKTRIQNCDPLGRKTGVKIKIDASPIPLFFGIRPESMIQREQKHTNWKLFPRYPPDKYVKIMSQESHSSRILNNKNKIVTMYVNVNVLSFSKSFVTKYLCGTGSFLFTV